MSSSPKRTQRGRKAHAGGHSTAASGGVNQRQEGLVIGIGASAGGLEAFRSFLTRMEPDSGMAFILVQHLSPDHESMLTRILAGATEMRVFEAKDGMAVDANCVYVIPPNATLIMKQRTLKVSTPAPPRAARRPIDSFFFSLAEDQTDNAICIVMAGTGSDGTLGLKAVKEAGGLALAQAAYDSMPKPGMPQSATATGLVDHVLAVEDMPAKLIEYRDHLRVVVDQKDGDGVRTDAAMHLGAIRSLLRGRLGHDFDKYREKTLVRRIQRRMQVLHIATPDAYVAHLREDAREAELLFRDLLIGVTQFFRDPEAFETLRSAALPAMLDAKDAADIVRIWVPGCSTGEEVYTIGMLLLEAMDERSAWWPIQIFGTDIDDRAIAFARAGRYTKTAGLSAERLARWFTEKRGEYLPKSRLREICVFSVHSIIKDPPFSKLDLISCRNVMIYMEGDLQDRVLRAFHYALNSGAVLFLGPSEGILRLAGLFSTIDQAAHLFRRSAGDAAFLRLPPPPVTYGQPPRDAPAPPDGNRIERIARRLLAKYSPAYLVTDREHNIVHFSGGEAGRYLEPAPGAPSSSLFDNLRQSLRTVVQSALRKAAGTKLAVVQDDVVVELDGVVRKVSIIVEPMNDGNDVVLYLLAFREGAPAGTRDSAPDAAVDSSRADAEEELRLVRAQLHSTIASLETTNEELRSAVEEYQSINEELQSSNEELATSKEEMQSINEELQTVNSEMNVKNELLSHLNSDLKNLLDSTQIATIFLDADLRIKNFTPGMADLFRLRDADRGRPLSELVALLDYEDLARDVARVLHDLGVVERELTLHDRSASFVMRMRAYRTVEDVIDGVVITFVDVTDRVKAFEALQSSEERFAAIFAQASVGVVETDLDGRVILANAKFQGIVGRSAAELSGLRLHEIAHPEDRAKDRALFEQLAAGRHAAELELRYLEPNGGTAWVHKSVSTLLDDQERPVGVLAVVLEISERKRGEEQTRLLLDELDHRVNNILALVSAVVSQTLKTDATPAMMAESVKSRIASITRAHNTLRHDPSGAVSLRRIIDIELEPYQADGRVISVEGIEIALTPKAGLCFALVLHELTSNAVKYGALSIAQGRLAVSWTIADGAERRLRLIWTEANGPPMGEPPKRRGFGSRLIERTLTEEFDASVKQEFLPSGLRCTIELALTADVGEIPPRGTEAR